MLYFAYGSNLNTAQMAERCPGAVKVGMAMLDGHQLVFNRHSLKRRCGVSSILPAPGSQVWGVVYRLTPDDLASLDRSEGYAADRPASRNGYNRQAVTVTLDGSPTEVETYVADSHDNPPLPNKTYVTLILEGAREHMLPAEYQAFLELIEHDPDATS